MVNGSIITGWQMMKNRNLSKLLFLLAGVLVVCPVLSPVLFHPEDQSKSAAQDVHWYIIRLGDQNVGYYKETVERLIKDGLVNFKTQTESRIILNRLGKRIELIFNSTYFETEDGVLKKVVSEQVMSSQPVKIEVEIHEGKAVLKSAVGGRSFSRELPYSGKLLGPEGIRQLTSRYLKRPGDSFEFQTLVAELSQVAKGQRQFMGEEELELNGEKIRAMKAEEKLSVLAYTRVFWFEQNGLEVQSVEPSPLGNLTTFLSTQREVLNALEEINPVQDLFQSSLIKANIRLPQARSLERVVIRIKQKSPELGWPDIQNDYQRVIHQDGKTVVIELKQMAVRKDQVLYKKAASEELAPYLKASAYIDPEDPEIKKLALRVFSSEKDTFMRAIKLRNWVSKNMTFDPGLVFAPSSEIIKNRRGTCAGYAALLCALLRSASIPSRYLFGLVYINGLWGGHAWVEAWIEGGWVPLDAAIPGPGVADPARLAVAWGSLEEGLSEMLRPAQKIFGNVEIDILEYSFRGKTYRIEPGKPAHEIKDHVYHNLGLNISLKAPAGFVFDDTDRVWPDKTLLTLKGPDDELVRLSQESWFPADYPEQHVITMLKKEVKDGKLAYEKVWGKKRPMEISAESSAVALVNGVDIFVLSARGKDSTGLLRKILKNFHNRLIIN